MSKLKVKRREFIMIKYVVSDPKSDIKIKNIRCLDKRFREFRAN